MSLCQIVDENDTVIGLKERSKIDHPKDCYRAAALWLTNSKGQILIAQRHINKDKNPGKWGPAAAGTVEEGETYESNIYKEADEEIGLRGVQFTPGPKTRSKAPSNHFTQWFFGACDISESEFVLQPTEVQAVQWVDKQHLALDIQAHPSKYVPSMLYAFEILNS